MSAVERRRSFDTSRPAALAPPRRVLLAEVVRWRGSTLVRLPWLGVGAGAVLTVMSLVTPAGAAWPHLLAYLSLWVTGFGPLAAALLAATAAHADRCARGGGTWWRAVDPRSTRLARFAAVMAAALVMDAAAVVLPAVATALVTTDPAPVRRLLAVVVVVWLGQCTLVAVVLRTATSLGRLPGLAVALVWLVLAVLTAERALWWLLPPAWLVRGALPLTETHASGLGVSGGEALASASPWAPALLSVVMALAVLLPSSPRRAGR